MNQDQKEPSSIMLDAIITKMQKQDQRIYAQEEKLTHLETEVKVLPEYANDIVELKRERLGLAALGKGQGALMEQLQRFFNMLDIGMTVLRNPPPTRVEHHHHVQKMTWIAAGLFLLLCLVCSGWYMTAQHSKQYQANDIKYRSLKLVADSTFHRFLHRLDSSYRANPEKMTEYVMEQEGLIQDSLELTIQLQAVKKKIGQDTKTGQQPKKGK